jgi:hypothetical protein
MFTINETRWDQLHLNHYTIYITVEYFQISFSIFLFSSVHPHSSASSASTSSGSQALSTTPLQPLDLRQPVHPPCPPPPVPPASCPSSLARSPCSPSVHRILTEFYYNTVLFSLYPYCQSGKKASFLAIYCLGIAVSLIGPY